MKGWKVLSAGEAVLEDMGAMPVPDDCIKLKMLTAALSLSETLTYRGKNGKLPVILGKSAVGMVSETGKDVTKYKRGDIVYVAPTCECGTCAHCKAGKPRECTNKGLLGKTTDGVMRDFMVVTESSVFLLPDFISEDDGVFVDMIASGISVIDALNPEKGEFIVIMGANAEGLVLAQLALYYQAVPIVIDNRHERLKIAEKLGVYYTVDATNSDPVKKVFSFTCGKMAEAMVYTVPSAFPVQRSFDCVMTGGKAAVFGTSGVTESANFNLNVASLISRKVTISFISDGCGNIHSAINSFASKAVDTAPLIDYKIKLDEVGDTLKSINETNEQDFCVVMLAK